MSNTSARSRRDSQRLVQGTAHAIAVNKDFIDRGGEKDSTILSGDHIYQMDYGPLIQFHRENKARFTIATMPVLPSGFTFRYCCNRRQEPCLGISGETALPER